MRDLVVEMISAAGKGCRRVTSAIIKDNNYKHCGADDDMMDHTV